MQNQLWIINGAVMRDLVIRQAFGRAIDDPTRGVIRGLTVALFIEAPAATELLTATVAKANNVSRVTAAKHIQNAVTAGIVSSRQDSNDNRRWLYEFAPGLDEKLTMVRSMEVRIMAVLSAQMLEPDNPLAGKGLIPDDFYFNLADPESLALFKTRIAREMWNQKKERQAKSS